MSIGNLGTTLFSFADLWATNRVTWGDLLAVAAKLGPGIEIDGYVFIRGYPAAAPAVLARLRNDIEEAGLVLTCLGADVDLGRYPERLLTQDEQLESLRVQLRVAHELGAPILRVQLGPWVGLLERVLPLADRLGVRIGVEVHAPETPASESVAGLIRLCERLATRSLGIIPDMSSSMHALPAAFLGQLRGSGMSESLLKLLDELWRTPGHLAMSATGWTRRAEQLGATPSEVHAGLAAFRMFAHAPVAEWRDVLPHAIHIHAKFFDVVNGAEPAVDYRGLLSLLTSENYSGSISSEWEGSPSLGLAEVADQLSRHRTLVERGLGLATSTRATPPLTS